MKRVVLQLVLTAFLVGLAHLAHATTDELKLTSGGAATVTIVDNGVGDLNPAGGTILYSNTNFDGWDISFAGGTSNSPSVSPFGIDIGSLTARCLSGGGCTTDAPYISYPHDGFNDPACDINDYFTSTYRNS